MGSGSSARKKAYAKSSSDSGVLKKTSDGELLTGNSGKKAADKKKQTALLAAEKHLADCKVTDLQKVYTIRQAFPLSSITGHRSSSMLPEKVHCASCRTFILKLDDETETEFFACKSCWEIGFSIGICGACHDTLAQGAPMRPSSARSRNSGAEPRGSKASLVIPHIKSGTSLEPPRSRPSNRSNRSLSSGSSEDDVVENRQIFARIHTDTSRNYLRKHYAVDRRKSDPAGPAPCGAENDGGADREGGGPEAPVRRASEMPGIRLRSKDAPPSRPGSRGGSKQRPSRQGSRQTSKETDENAEAQLLPSGVWSATILEGSGKKQKTRTEERHLHFHPDGLVQGLSSFQGNLEGQVKRPDVEWTEFYDWGSMRVKLKYHRTEPWHMEGTFEASDGGHGKMTLVHEQLKAAVEMGT